VPGIVILAVLPARIEICFQNELEGVPAGTPRGRLVFPYFRGPAVYRFTFADDDRFEIAVDEAGCFKIDQKIPDEIWQFATRL